MAYARRPTTTPTNVSLKLLIDRKSNRLLFAEADKKFVDFLFNTMSLSVGTVIKILGKQGTQGSIANIYDCIENFGDSYMQSATKKDILLKPMVIDDFYDGNIGLLFPSMQPSKCMKTILYKCINNCCGHVTNEPTKCIGCRSIMNRNVTFVKPTSNGFVNKLLTYMITDDLVVSLMSGTEIIITLLDKFNIKGVGDFEERVVAVGVNEGMELLRVSMQSKDGAY